VSGELGPPALLDDDVDLAVLAAELPVADVAADRPGADPQISGCLGEQRESRLGWTC
jgi:hypothetical protein